MNSGPTRRTPIEIRSPSRCHNVAIPRLSEHLHRIGLRHRRPGGSGCGIRSRRNDEIVFEIASLSVEDQVDAVVNLLYQPTRILANTGAPVLRVLSEIVFKGDRAIERRARDAGAEYLQKPVRHRTLIETVERAIERCEGR